MGVREALLIATSVYADEHLGRLEAPGRDVRSLAEVLAAPDIGGYTVRTVVDRPAHVIRQEVQRFLVRRRRDDQLLLYFSCHGLKDDDGGLYFAGTDTAHDPDLLESGAVSADFLSRRLDLCAARAVVVLLDCCYSGAFRPGAKGGASVDLRRRFDGTGVAVITATNALQYAWEGGRFREAGGRRGRLSVFTSAVVEGLRTGEADLDGDGWVSVDDLYRHVSDRLLADGAGQTPNRWLLGEEGTLMIARAASGERAPVARNRFARPPGERHGWSRPGPLRSAVAVLAAGVLAALGIVLWAVLRTGAGEDAGATPGHTSTSAGAASGKGPSSAPPTAVRDPLADVGDRPAGTAQVMRLAPCGDGDVYLALESARNAYADEDPHFTLTLTTPSGTPACRVDVEVKAVELTVVTSDDELYWSSADCALNRPRNRWVRLSPDAPVVVGYDWNRSRSAPGCRSPGAASAGKGTYLVTATSLGRMVQTSFILSAADGGAAH